MSVVEVIIRGEFGELHFKKFGPDKYRVSIHERDIEHELKRTAALLDEVRGDFGAIVRSHEKTITGAPDPVSGFPR